MPHTSPSPLGARTLLDALAELRRSSAGMRWYRGDGSVRHRTTYRELERRARSVAAHLQTRLRPGDRAVLVYPDSEQFVTAYWGCVLAGVVAVPAARPTRRHGLEALARIASDADARVVLTEPALQGELAPLDRVAALPDDVALGGQASAWREPAVSPGTLALLQYTSGSTGDPKGVMVTHGNLVHNTELVWRLSLDGSTALVSWLPHFHDMGLIGAIMSATLHDLELHLVSPMQFVKRPRLFLEMLSGLPAATVGAPNFGYQLCADRAAPDGAPALDLGGWRRALVGAEPVRADTLRRFAGRFAGAGFDARAFRPVYGLAEATLLATGVHPDGAPPRSIAACRRALAAGRVESSADAERAVELVSCGRPPEGVRLVIVDPERRTPRAPGEIGEIWLQGPSVAAGYHRRPAETTETFAAELSAAPGEGRFLRTGDLGCAIDGELFVTGRRKDVVIVRGRKLHAEDVEALVRASHPALAGRTAAAFAIRIDGVEELAVAVELGQPDDGAAVARAIRGLLTRELDVAPREIVLAPSTSLPITTSGKIRRAACRAAFERGDLRRPD